MNWWRLIIAGLIAGTVMTAILFLIDLLLEDRVSGSVLQVVRIVVLSIVLILFVRTTPRWLNWLKEDRREQ